VLCTKRLLEALLRPPEYWLGLGELALLA